jgi:hypothetical protein
MMGYKSAMQRTGRVMTMGERCIVDGTEKIGIAL